MDGTKINGENEAWCAPIKVRYQAITFMVTLHWLSYYICDKLDIMSTKIGHKQLGQSYSFYTVFLDISSKIRNF